MSYFNSERYLPQPPRVWSRVQNSCSLSTAIDNNDLVRDPYTGQLVTPVVLAERIAMLNKGNILQYKANSSNLTKSQKYSKIAKGQWVNRNTTWATQSTRGYTNPNTTSLKRDGNINIAIDPITGAVIGPTTANPTCPKPVNPINPALPSNGGGGSDVKDPNIPPPVPPTPGSDVFPVIIPVTPVEPFVIQDGGNLICSIQENICTGEIKRTLGQQLCHPTTDSDVPGPIQELCWNDGMQTWYPRQRYIMTNSTNKWPTNYKFLVSAIKLEAIPPILAVINDNETYIDISWSVSNFNLVNRFNIYVNKTLYKTVTNNGLFTAKITNLPNDNNEIYITSIIQSGQAIESSPSNLIFTGKKNNNQNLNDEDVADIDCIIKYAVKDISKDMTKDVVEYYNKLLKNTAIIQINTYLMNYMTNINNPNNLTYMTTDAFNSLNGYLYTIVANVDMVKSVLNTYVSILKTLFLSYNTKRQLIDTQYNLIEYKQDHDILHNTELLKKYIEQLNKEKQKQSMLSISITTPLLQIAEEYLIYNQTYGIPDNYIYDQVILNEIRLSLEND